MRSSRGLASRPLSCELSATCNAAADASVHQLLRQIGIVPRPAGGVGGGVRVVGVTAEIVLVVEVKNTHTLQLGGKLARVAGVDPVGLCVGGDQGLRIAHARLQVLIAGIFGDEGAVLGLVGIAVFAHPRSAGRQVVVAQHVDV